MPDFEEIMGNAGDNVKQAFKNKKFWIAAAGVGVVALFVGFRKNTTTEGTTLTTAQGYTGYPAISGSSEDTAPVMNYGQDQNDNSYDLLYSALEGMDRQYSYQIDQMTDNIYALSDQLVTTQELTEKQAAQLKQQNVISQMQANSNLYNTIGDVETRKALHDENLSLAQSIGAVYDKVTGNYFVGDSVLYTTAQQEANLLAGKSAAKPYGGENVQVSNTDYQAQINSAILSGASASVINSLNEQRNAKITAQGGATTAQIKGFDASQDYSVLIKEAKQAGATAQVISNLEQQRQNKIDALYGGKDPAKK